MVSASNPTQRGGNPSPWTQIVIGSQSDITTTNSTAKVSDINNQIVQHSLDMRPVKSVSEQLDDVNLSIEEPVVTEPLEYGLNSNVGKKTVWNKPSASPSPSEDVSPLIGATAAWPALSELTKVSTKPASPDYMKNLPEGSSSVPQLFGMSSSSQRQGNNSKANSSSHTNQTVPTRQRSFRQGNVGGSGNPSNSMTTNGGFSPAPAPPSQRPANPESLSGENPYREGVGQRGGFVPQSNSGIEQQQRNSYRRGSGGAHPRGDGSHYHNHVGRRDQDRNPHRNFGGRGAHMQPQRGSTRPFLRGPPPANTPYLPPPMPLLPSFGTPMGYPGPEVFYFSGPPQDPFRPGTMVPPMGPFFYPFVDPLLQTKIINQIEYYFSPGNLIGDSYLRRNMDEHGWVSIKLIAGFKKVSELTDNVQLIMAALQASNVVEIEGEKLRRRDDWQQWVYPPPVQHVDMSSPRSVQQSGQEMLAVRLQNVHLDKRSVRNIDNENHPSRSSSGEFSSQ